MKILFATILAFAGFSACAQQDTANHSPAERHDTYERHSIMPTVCLGFIDGYRNNYSLPSGFEKNNTSGFAPVLVKLEYGLSKHISLAATFGYDAFIYNFSQLYQGNNGPFVRYKTDVFRSFSGGLTGFYHLGDVIRVNNLDPFAGVGIELNNIRYSAYPTGDSTAIKFNHTATFYLKIGARYYISNRFSVFADAGYDKQSIVSAGFSCRFFSKKKGS